MRIGEVADRSGVPTKTIRYYEEFGVMPEPSRSANGYREYGEDAVVRLRFIRDGQASGLSLAEIASILEMRDRGEQTCEHVMTLLRTHLADIDVQIERLVTTRRRLAEMADRAAARDPAACADPDRCQTIEPGLGASLRPSTPPVAHRHDR